MPGAPPPRIPLATSVAAVDTSTSVVIRPDPADQITCRKDAIQTISDVVFTTRVRPDGKSMDLLMDVQIPMPRGKRHPLVIYVPGGGFMMSEKEQALNLRTYVADAGFVVASVQYRTMLNGATFRDSVADVKSAIRYLRANAQKYDIDADRVAVWGESAGGYLVAMVGVTNGVKSFDVGNDLDRNSDVQAVVDKFGPSDVSKIAADFDPQLQASYQAHNPFLPYVEGSAATAANPLTYIKATAPPFLIFHGSQDRLISPSQTLLLHNALVSAGVRSTRYVLEGAGHGDLAFMGDLEAGLPWSTRQTMGIIVDFLRVRSTEFRRR
jgi:acetyl esterase/lipase